MNLQTLYTDHDVQKLDVRNVRRTTKVLFWNRAGQLRVVNEKILQEAFRLYDDAEEMVKAGRMPAVPPEWSSIYWESCRPVQASSTVKVTPQS